MVNFWLLIVTIVIATVAIIYAYIKGVERGYDHGKALADEEADTRLQDYLLDQQWQYEDAKVPMRRVNKVTGEVQKRYQHEYYNQSFYPSKKLTDWQTVYAEKGRKK